MLLGSAISVTSTSPILIVQTLRSAKDALLDDLQTANSSSLKKTADQIGSSMSAWIEEIEGPAVH